MNANVTTAWLGFLAGCIAGAVPGLFFHRAEWLGGYGSWPRRMLRMAHITFFGFGVLNLAFGLTCRVLELRPVPALPSVLLIVGAVTMPTVCYLSAWRPEFRRMFVVPAAAVIIAAIAFLVRLFR